MHVIDVKAMVLEVTDIVIGLKSVMHVIDVMAMVMEVVDPVIGSKL